MTDDARTRAALERLQPLVGEWDLAMDFSFVDEPVVGRATFEWALGNRFLILRSTVPGVPEAPEGLSIIAPNHEGDGYTNHYYDSRGVVRLYAMTFDGRDWVQQRSRPDFTPLSFHQRFVATLEGDAITGAWETSGDGNDWKLDFPLVYTRLS